MSLSNKLSKWVISSIVGLACGCSSVSEDGTRWVEGAPEPGSDTDAQSTSRLGVATQAITGTTKVCSCVVGDEFRDTLPVPSGWVASRCRTHCELFVGAAQSQLGCFFGSGTPFTFGAAVNIPTVPTAPATNCGW
jgi:hypothetical protein